MPGQTDGERVVRTLILLVAFPALGHTNRHGPFRLHLLKIISFLKQQLGLAVPAERRECIERMLVTARARVLPAHHTTRPSLRGRAG